MKLNVKPTILPWFTLGAGGLGICLRLWLLGQIDPQGLLPAGHIAGVLSFILFAAVLAVLFLCTSQLQPMSRHSQLFPASYWGALGCVLGALGIIVGLFEKSSPLSSLSLIYSIAGIVGAGALLFTGYCRLTGRHPAFGFHCVISVYFMLYLVVQCRQWGAQPQLQLYFFQFIACIFLLLSVYQRTTLDAGRGIRRWYVFFNQATVFCCLMASVGSNKLFYLTMAVWSVTNLCSVQPRLRRQIAHSEED